MTIYIVVRRSTDVTPKMVEVLGVFRKRPSAEERVLELFERFRVTAQIEAFMPLDDRYPSLKPSPATTTRRTKRKAK